MKTEANHLMPGPVILFGSGETTPNGRKIFNRLFERLQISRADQPGRSGPLSPRIAILETPAGFELNSPQVAGRVADFLYQRFQNLHPQVNVIPARQRGTTFSPDNLQIVAPLLAADLIFMGPGSPTYTVNQLRDSLAWHTLAARHRLGAALALASAAAIAISAFALPVYEIYKVGEKVHWKNGLDFFGPFGLSLIFIPHWNNTDGGEELDTSRCFMGKKRFDILRGLVPAGMTLLGIDEQTGLLIDLAAGGCEVVGKGGVAVMRAGRFQRFEEGERFSISELGDFHLPEPHQAGLPEHAWRRAKHAAGEKAAIRPPEAILVLVEKRQTARESRDWPRADELREQIVRMGWKVMDTEEGPVVEESREQ